MKKFANQVKVTQHQHGTQKGFKRLYFFETDGFLHKESFNLKYIAFTYNGVMKRIRTQKEVESSISLVIAMK